MYGLILQIVVILIGVIMLTLAIVMLARKKLEVNACVTWGFMAIVFIIAGLVLRPNGWIQWMSPTGMILLIVVGICCLLGLFRISSSLSTQVRKNNELAMQVSLLNFEMAEMMEKVSSLEEQLEATEKGKEIQ